jgi:hypothetical protein
MKTKWIVENFTHESSYMDLVIVKEVSRIAEEEWSSWHKNFVHA